MPLFALRARSSGLLTVILVALALLSAAACMAASHHSPAMHFRGFGPATLGDRLKEVRSEVSGLGPCHYLSGNCVCAPLENRFGETRLTFVFALDGRPGLDLVFTGDSGIKGPMGLQVGDPVRRVKALFPHAKHRKTYPGFTKLVVRKGLAGMMVFGSEGKITTIATGRNRFFEYEEFCS